MNETALWPWMLFVLAMPAVAIGGLVWQHLHYKRADREREYKRRPVKSETWMEAREKRARGEFHRKVARRVAISLDHDELELECGHRWPAVGEQRESYECTYCLKAWTEAQPK